MIPAEQTGGGSFGWVVRRLVGLAQRKAERRADEVREAQARTGLTLHRRIRIRVFELDASRHNVPGYRQKFYDINFRMGDGRLEVLPAGSQYDTWFAIDQVSFSKLMVGPTDALALYRLGHVVSIDQDKPVTLRDVLQFNAALPELRALWGKS